jgi:hypothetical protein
MVVAHQLCVQRATDFLHHTPSSSFDGVVCSLAAWKENSNGRCTPVVGCGLDQYLAELSPWITLT